MLRIGRAVTSIPPSFSHPGLDFTWRRGQDASPAKNIITTACTHCLIGLPFVADEKIAIEVDGPHHFTANTLQVTGEMLARQKLLNARGWAVISVPFFRWSGKTDTERAEWFQPVSPLA